MSATSLPLAAAPLQSGIRRLTIALMGMSVGQALIWLGSALYNFYAGPRLLVLAVRAGLKFGTRYTHVAVTLPSPAGYFSTGMQGELLYRPTAFSDYFLFHRIGDFTGLDAMFLAGVGVYLYRALGRRAVVGAPAPGASRALALVSLASLLMYLLSMALNVLAREVLQAKTQQVFTLGSPSGVNLFYVVLGMVLGLGSQLAAPSPQEQPEPARPVESPALAPPLN